MTQAHTDRKYYRSILDQVSIDQEQTYRKRHGCIRAHRTKNDGNRSQQTEDVFSRVRAND
jgi:hypothetical protein